MPPGTMMSMRPEQRVVPAGRGPPVCTTLHGIEGGCRTRTPREEIRAPRGDCPGRGEAGSPRPGGTPGSGPERSGGAGRSRPWGTAPRLQNAGDVLGTPITFQLLGVPYLFRGRHTFSIEARDIGRVPFVQQEAFSGLFVPLALRTLDATRRGFEAMNRALEGRAEAGAGPIRIRNRSGAGTVYGDQRPGPIPVIPAPRPSPASSAGR